MDTGTITPLVKRLEANGLVTRKRDRSDGRRVLVDLTVRCRALEPELRRTSSQMQLAWWPPTRAISNFGACSKHSRGSRLTNPVAPTRVHQFWCWAGIDLAPEGGPPINSRSVSSVHRSPRVSNPNARGQFVIKIHIKSVEFPDSVNREDPHAGLPTFSVTGIGGLRRRPNTPNPRSRPCLIRASRYGQTATPDHSRPIPAALFLSQNRALLASHALQSLTLAALQDGTNRVHQRWRLRL